ncbi:uncharacterized protein LOC131629650 [Vicia villosa]|uniref:uncharacterized protein LOC131629650 n=1 Tax=Vicia villosa TaxID=3911 RepID=UPI00273AA34C|nr:uncharacterized protein LOC131629650 [Vicia villosa]
MNTPNKIMVWNHRGATSKSFYRYCKQYVDLYHPSMIVILKTRCDPNLLKNSFSKLGFDEIMVVDNRGYSGGIVAAWNKSSLEVKCCTREDQLMHLHIIVTKEQEFYFTVVYANPQENRKKIMWEKLKEISASIQKPWLVAGDFNDIASSSEKRGGLQASQSRCTIFRNRFQNCKIDDLEARGPNFTWRGPIFHGGQQIYEKLDRALCNDSWRWRFLDAYVKVLAPVEFSNHHPILIVPTMTINNKLEKPFRFENAWLIKDSYHVMIKQIWNNEANFLQNIRSTREGIKEWKFETFDEVRRNKAVVMRRLEGIQRKLQQHYNYGGMKRLEAHLQKELSTILKQEELIWFQRAKTNWLKDGDRNTRYYHMKASTRRKRNKIHMLKDKNGTWVDENDTLQKMVTQYFKSMFDSTNKCCQWFQTDVSFPKLSARVYVTWMKVLQQMKLEELYLQ